MSRGAVHSRRDSDLFDACLIFWDWETACSQGFDIKPDRVGGVRQCFFACPPISYNSGQSGNSHSKSAPFVRLENNPINTLI